MDLLANSSGCDVAYQASALNMNVTHCSKKVKLKSDFSVTEK